MRWPLADLSLCWLLLVTAGLCSGCGESGGTVEFTGVVFLDGLQVPAEIQVEQLDSEGSRTGQSVAAYADESGRFSATIERSESGASPLTCRFVVRVSQFSSDGLLTAFDENAPHAKVVRLRRSISNNDTLTFLLTR